MGQIVMPPFILNFSDNRIEIRKMDECGKYETCLKILNNAFSKF
jgi:hypothetical protein